MATEIEYALMAGRTYQSTRATINWLPDLQSQGWTEFFPQQHPSGFEAISFQKGNQIVIAFAGTGSAVDWWANAGGFFGVTSDQLKQAADYFLQVKAANPGATISFTGHSLGGGLASLMAVFFGETATTFDQAPFRNSASASVASSLYLLLIQQGYSEAALQGLTNFISASASGGIPNESNVHDISVQGEILSAASGLRIGTPTSLTHGAPDLLLTINLHSQALLSAFVQNDSFRQVTFTLPDVVRMIFDSNLFENTTASSNTTEENFIERLVRHQSGIVGNPATGETSVTADAMLTRFTNDLWKLAQDGGLTMADNISGGIFSSPPNDVSKTLIAFDMQKYYGETPTGAGYNQELFATVRGGVQFDRADVATTLDDAKGYNLYFQNYLASNAFINSERQLIEPLLPILRDWYVQAGSGGMTAVDLQNRGAFMLGGSRADDLTGGSQADLLIGNAGDDRLTGGGGNDTLLGGAGFDLYYYQSVIDGHDTIEDSDARGAIVVNGQVLTGGVKKTGQTEWTSSDGTIHYRMSGTDLIVELNGTQIMTVNENFQSGQFGINLFEEPDTPSYDNGWITQRLYLETGEMPDGPILVSSSNLILYGSESSTNNMGEGWSRYWGNDQLFGYGGGDFIAGGLGHDRVYGGDGNDYIIGGIYFISGWPEPLTENVDSLDGNDALYGEGGDDRITGFAGDDRLHGGDGADILMGDGDPTIGYYFGPSSGKDFLDGGVGNDFLYGDYGSDVLLGGDGVDRLQGDYILHRRVATGGEPQGTLFGVPFIGVNAKDDFLDGGAGDDELYGDGGDDTLVGGDGNDQLFGDYGEILLEQDAGLLADFGNDVLDGGLGDDLVYGMGGDDALVGVDGIDRLYGGDGADELFGGAGDDFLLGDYIDNENPGNDLMYGDAGNDVLIGEAGDDLLDGGDDGDELQGGAGADVLFGGSGDDRLFGEVSAFQGVAGDDLLDGGDGNDELQGGGGADELFGGSGDDRLYGEETAFQGVAGDDLLDGEEGDDHVQGGGGADTLFGGVGNDQLFGDDPLDLSVAGGNDWLDGEDGIDELQGGLGNDTLFGGDGDDVLFGDRTVLDPTPSSGGDDVLDGEAGNDILFGDSGNDVLTGGSGNDSLNGGAGQDTYVFDLGDGLDTIVDTVTGGANRIVFGEGITADQLTYALGSTTLSIGYNGAVDVVQLAGFNQNTVQGSLVVSTLEFADGSLVNLADVFAPFTNYAPTLATPLADLTAAEDAPLNVLIPANTFADQDAGDTLTYSASLADGTALPGWLSFDANTRTLSGTPNDAQVGTLDLKVTATDGRLESVSDIFTLSVTGVNDAPTVAAPVTDQFATKDVPFSFVVPVGTFADVDLGDTLAYGASLADGSPLPSWLTFNPSTRTFSGTPQMTDVGVFNVRITATDSGNLSIGDVFAFTVAHGLNEIIGTAGSETLLGTPGNDLIRGLAGDDTLSGLDGNDTLDGGDGDDQLYGGNGTNVLVGGVGSDRLEGYTGNDTFQGGPGNDTVYDPYGGQNVYLFDRGDGQDTINSSVGTVRFAPGVLPAEVTVRGNRDLSLTLSLPGTTDQINIAGWMNPSSASRIDRVEFSDGTVWNLATLQTMASTGTVGNDYLGGTNGNDVLVGLGGNDLIQAYSGNDVLDGGAGNDTLWGGIGDDTYVFGRGYGADLIQDDGGIADKLQLASGILTSDVTLLQNGSVLLLSIDQSATQMIFTGIEQIVFTGGPLWDAAAIASHMFVGSVNAMSGTAGNDTFVVDNTLDTVTEVANQGADTIQSLVSYTLPGEVENLTLTGYFNVDGAGNLLDNVIVGNSGNNKLSGGAEYWGAGADTLQGGLGDDSYTVIGNNDLVIEAPNEGVDTVTLIGDANRGWNYTMPDNVENVIVGSASQVLSSARSFYGNALSNVIQGDADWFNYIDGGLGADTMVGARFSDTYVVDNPGDVIVETGSFVDTVLSSISYTLGAKIENLTLTGNAAINGTGNELNNVLTGNSAANILTGGAGDDTYVIGAGDTIVELSGQGTDTVSSDQSVILSADLENVILTGTEAINATGNSSDNVLTGNSAANVLDGGAGADQLIGGDGDDTYLVGAGDTIVEQPFNGIDTVIANQTFSLSSDLENLTLTGTASVNGTGNTLDNILTGNSGANVLAGGAGDDTYVVDSADTIVENPGEGIDTVQASGNWVLASDLENLVLTGTSAINGTGNAANNILTGNSAANVLTGGAGDDTYIVDGGDPIIELANEGTDTVQSSASFILAPNLEHLTLTGTAAINGTGNVQNNILTGNSGANVLDGGAGADTMFGDTGDDSYVVDNIGDTVTENAAAGTDTVKSSITYTLGANLENLTLLGNSAINGTGNSLANVLIGNSAANVLAGGAGNDTYIVDAGDTVTEGASAGTDQVQSAVTFTLGANLENLTLTGTAAINGTGNTLNNILIGNSAANVLSGGTGSDTMSGGAGDDTYVVNVTGDVVTELANEGTDTVQSAVTWTLGSNVEHLTLTGTTAINGTGNALDNVLTGNSAANTLTGGAGHDMLDGGAGNDTMVGGTGNDTYVVNATGDIVTEQANEGTDTVLSAVTRTLGANFENLTLTGTTAVNGTGNTLDNVLTGNSAVNTLTGGAGNDTYVVSIGDTVTEAASAGTDTVQSAITWTLGANTENLTLIGSSTINGTGNTVNNTMAGNSANNTLTGLGGNDTYLYGRGGGQDTVIDNSGTADTMLFGATINPLDLVLSRQANDLRLTIHGSTDSVTIKNWYTSQTTNQVETIQAGNGQTMLNSQVDQLIQAMATFTTQSGLTWDQAIDQRPQDVQTVLATSWH